MLAVGKSCRIMFMRARPAVVTSFSWPSSVMCLPASAAILMWAFVISAVVSGAAGALFVKQFGFVAPSLIGFGLSTEVLIWVAVGGRNVLMAAFLGAVSVRSVEGALSDRLGDYWLLVLGVLFVLTVVFMPNGLFGRMLVLPPARRLRTAGLTPWPSRSPPMPASPRPPTAS